MASDAVPMKLPVIDFSKDELRPGTSYWDLAKTKIRDAIEKFGCFEVVYDKEIKELNAPLFRSAKELYELPLEVKNKHVLPKPWKGYLGPELGNLFYEGSYILNATDPEQVKSFAKLMWPEGGNPNFCETVSKYISLVEMLDRLVKKMIFESYGAEKDYEPFINANWYQFGFQKYQPGLLDKVSHTDRTLITMIHQNEVDGLEIQTPDGKWHSLSLSPTSFVFIMGEAFMALSNGRFFSPNHRVKMRGDITRFSAGLFSFCKDLMKPPEGMVDEEHPVQFKPFYHEDFIRFAYFTEEGLKYIRFPYDTEEGLKAMSVVKEYCGV